MNQLEPDFSKKINPDQHMKLIHHFSESTKNQKPEISDSDGVRTEFFTISVECGTVRITTYSKAENKDHEISMFVSGDLKTAEKWFLKILEFNGVRFSFPD